MNAIAQRLGVEAQIFSTPTSIFAAIGPVGAQTTYMLRVEPGDPDLERLVRVDHVVQRVASGELSPGAGVRALEMIPSPSGRWGLVTTLLAFSLASACAGAFFGGSFGDIASAGVVGVLVGAMAIVGSMHREARRVIEAVAAAGASAVALVLERVVSPGLVGMGYEWATVDAVRVTLSGLIVLLPGLTLTLAMSELASRHLVSGTGRLTHAAMILLSVGFGVAVGRSVLSLLPDVDVVTLAAPGWVTYVALAAAPLGFTVLFRARPLDVAVIALAGVLGFFAARFGAGLLGPEVGASVGALVVGMISNLYGRVFNMPSAVASIPGIMLLVPGSLGFRSIEALLGADATAGVQGVFTTLLVGASLVVGLLLANIAVPMKREL